MTKYDYAEVWLKRPTSFGGETLPAGASVKVHDQDSIGLICASPPAEQYIRIDLVNGKKAKHAIVVDGEWKYNVPHKEAEEAVKEGVPAAEQAEEERRQALRDEHADVMGEERPTPAKKAAKKKG